MLYPVIYHQARDGDVLQRPSRFITDLDKDLMEEWNVKSVY
jgi:DNA helicase-2/ATP-dependent DNA helicase PcrA